MTELQTLKDLIKREGKMGTYPMVSKKDLKQEAIKELKLVDNPLRDREMIKVLELDKKCGNETEISNALFGIRRFLIWKFNISEGDLI